MLRGRQSRLWKVGWEALEIEARALVRGPTLAAIFCSSSVGGTALMSHAHIYVYVRVCFVRMGLCPFLAFIRCRLFHIKIIKIIVGANFKQAAIQNLIWHERQCQRHFSDP